MDDTDAAIHAAKMMLDAFASALQQSGRLTDSQIAGVFCAFGHLKARDAGLSVDDVIAALRRAWSKLDAAQGRSTPTVLS